MQSSNTKSLPQPCHFVKFLFIGDTSSSLLLSYHYIDFSHLMQAFRRKNTKSRRNPRFLTNLTHSPLNVIIKFSLYRKNEEYTMSLDGFSMHPLVRELNTKLAGGRIDKITQPNKQSVILSVRQ